MLKKQSIAVGDIDTISTAIDRQKVRKFSIKEKNKTQNTSEILDFIKRQFKQTKAYKAVEKK
jgi:hypothetical protein